MKALKLALISIALLLPGTSFSAAGEICESVLNDNTQGAGNFRVDNTTQFICPTAGIKTIPQLYAAGWLLLAVPHTQQIGNSTNYLYKLYIYQ